LRRRRLTTTLRVQARRQRAAREKNNNDKRWSFHEEGLFNFSKRFSTTSKVYDGLNRLLEIH
jgi:hypothetical protein